MKLNFKCLTNVTSEMIPSQVTAKWERLAMCLNTRPLPAPSQPKPKTEGARSTAVRPRLSGVLVCEKLVT